MLQLHGSQRADKYFPTNPITVAAWEKFKRSGWSDPTAFQVVDALDSAFSQLLLTPVVAAIFGAIGSAMGHRPWTPKCAG